MNRVEKANGDNGSADAKPYLPRTRTMGKGKYVLIFGGAGFIGTNVARRFLKEGKNVLIYDNLSRPGSNKNLEWLFENFGNKLSVQVADVRDKLTVNKAVKNASNVFHFAAQVAVTTSLIDPENDFDINARGTLNVLNAIRNANGVDSMLFTSTNKVYGGLEDLKFIGGDTRYYPVSLAVKRSGISESRPLDFHSPYGCSKGSADQYVLDYARIYDIPSAVFRMSCIYGPHQNGNEDQGWVAHFLIRAIENKLLSIYGDGKQVRDILFIDDLVNAFMLAKDHIQQIKGNAFNIGGGVQNTISLLELISVIEDMRGEPLPVKYDKSRPGDQVYYVSDIRKFNKATGWMPKNSVTEGVSKLYQWLCESHGATTIRPVIREKKTSISVQPIAV